MTEHYRTRIAAERQRQIDVEGHTADEDREQSGALLAAAAAYAAEAERVERGGDPSWPLGNAPHIWPWMAAYWKPTSPERMREKAGALALAAIDAMAGGRDVITDEEQSKALPEGSVIRTRNGDIYLRAGSWSKLGWYMPGDALSTMPLDGEFPAIVLYRGSAS